MPEPHEDVTQADPSTATVEVPDTGAVTPGDDRPLKNYQAEFNRKMTKVERQQAEVTQRLDAIAQLLINQQAQQQVAQVAPPVQSAGPETDEGLWARAQQGDRDAFDEYMARKARREVQQERSVANRGQLVASQMAALIGKYPVLNDGSHPLTQTAQAAYQLLIRSGYPAGQETLLEAAKTAIADRPDLVSDLYAQGAQAREGARRNSAQSAQSGQTGGSIRQDPPRAANAVTVRQGEVAIARRMLQGSKQHPEEKTTEQRAKGAKERFLARQASGESRLGAVSGFVNGEDF
jgi:hypothetical protein